MMTNDRRGIDALLDPARAFTHPDHVVAAAHLSCDEKRAILASWASDACAVEAMPQLRQIPAGRRVRWDAIIDALQRLDASARSQDASNGRRAGDVRAVL